MFTTHIPVRNLIRNKHIPTSGRLIRSNLLFFSHSSTTSKTKASTKSTAKPLTKATKATKATKTPKGAKETPSMSAPSIDSLLLSLSASPYHLHVRPSSLRPLLDTLLSSPRPPIGPALLQSLRMRVLATDITSTLQPYANLCFPATISSGTSLVLDGGGAVVAQVLDVRDLTVSRIDALDAIEMAGRGEVSRGREIIRLAPEDDVVEGSTAAAAAGAEAAAAVKKNTMHKLLLEDASGRRAWAVEEGRVEGVKEGMNIGTKMVLRGCGVARGVVLLGPATASVLGGRVEELHKAWMDGRVERVKAEIEAMKELR